MVVEKLLEALFNLVRSNGLISIAIFVVVIHFFSKHVLEWLRGGDTQEDNNTEDVQANSHPLLHDDGEINFIPYKPPRYSTKDLLERSRAFYENMNGRRSVRLFSDEDVPIGVIQNIVHTAGTAPSGAHTQPWTFVVVKSIDLKATIRSIVEREEEINYKQRMGKQWLKDLEKFKLNWVKPYLTIAPYLIIVMKQVYGIKSTGERQTNYYHEISVSIACGLLLAAIQNAGLATLTSTPLNAGPALRDLLNRPKNEKVVLLLPVGYPAKDCRVPDLTRKSVEDIMVIA